MIWSTHLLETEAQRVETKPIRRRTSSGQIFLYEFFWGKINKNHKFFATRLDSKIIEGRIHMSLIMQFIYPVPEIET